MTPIGPRGWLAIGTLSLVAVLAAVASWSYLDSPPLRRPTRIPPAVAATGTSHRSPGQAGPTATGVTDPSSAQPTPTASGKPSPIPRPSPTSSGSVDQSSPLSADRDLDDPHLKDIAMQIVSSAENSSLDWRAQYSYIQDIGDGRGYTAGFIGFCSGTGDMLALVESYDSRKPGNVLSKYLPALRRVNGTQSHAGLDPTFTTDWSAAASDTTFQRAQDDLRDSMYFSPAFTMAKADGLRALGQFIYFDAMVMHGPGNDPESFGGIRTAAIESALPPSEGGDEASYLNAFLDARVAVMGLEQAHSDTSRVDTTQRVFLRNGNLDLTPPLFWQVSGDTYYIAA
jgi:chitosanase